LDPHFASGAILAEGGLRRTVEHENLETTGRRGQQQET